MCLTLKVLFTCLCSFCLTQLLLIVPLATALCDFSYTIYQGAGGGSAAPYQYLTPLVLAITMVSWWVGDILIKSA